MFVTPDNSRIEKLNLQGLRFGALVCFCPRCDFQAPFVPTLRSDCPKCEAVLVLTTVTPDLLKVTRAA